MKIIHVISYFVPNAGYQENLLTLGQSELGHEVYVLTSHLEPEFDINKNNRSHDYGWYQYENIKVKRLEIYFEMLNRFVLLKNLYRELSEIKPDLIFYHSYDPGILPVLFYKLFNRKTKLVIDIHSDYNNSMNSWYGPTYHRLFLKNTIKLTHRLIDRVFAVSPETERFAKEVYNFKKDKLSILPLPGDSRIISDYDNIRKKVRERYSIKANELVFLHSGKLPEKKKTEELLEAFSSIKSSNIKLFIAGSINKEFEDKFNNYLKKDNRIIFVGWITAEELRKYMIASDLLIQPGSLSNTFIDAICMKLPLLLHETPQGKYLTSSGNGLLMKDNDVESIKKMIDFIINDNVLAKLKENANLIYKKYDYVEVAKESLK